MGFVGYSAANAGIPAAIQKQKRPAKPKTLINLPRIFSPFKIDGLVKSPSAALRGNFVVAAHL